MLPPALVADIRGWAQYLKPAGEQIGIPEISYHWFRRGHATAQHHEKLADKPIQGQLRHSKAENTRNIYMQHVSGEQYRAVVDLETTVQGMIDKRKGVV